MYHKGVGRSPGVERPYIEAAERPRIYSSARSAEIFFYLSVFFTYEETAVVASRYIEGHALTLCNYTVLFNPTQ